MNLLELINPDPTITRFNDISIVNQSLYLFPIAGLSLPEMGNLLAGGGLGIDAIDLRLLEVQLGGPPGPSGGICSPGQGATCPMAVPEPGSLTLLCFGLIGLAAARRHRRGRRKL